MSSAGRKETSRRIGPSSASGRTTTGFERSIDKAALVNKLLRTIEQRLEKDELKATLGDFIRLLQLQKELEDEQPREIEITWVEPQGPVSANEG